MNLSDLVKTSCDETAIASEMAEFANTLRGIETCDEHDDCSREYTSLRPDVPCTFERVGVYDIIVPKLRGV
ncbi:MAG: hypothetical protein RSC43_02080 [Clostridia bacterium]